MKNLVFLLMCFLLWKPVASQTIKKIDFILDWKSCLQSIPVKNKGVYMLFPNAVALVDPVKKSYKLFDKTDSSKQVHDLKGMSYHNGKLIAYAIEDIYELAADGFFKKLKLSFSPSIASPISNAVLSGDSITVSHNGFIYSLRNGSWKYFKANIKDFRTSLTEVYPLEGLVLLKTSHKGLIAYWPGAAENQPLFSGEEQLKQILHLPDEAVWVLTTNRIMFINAVGKPMVTQVPSTFLKGTGNNGFAETAKLVADENNKVYYADMQLQVRLEAKLKNGKTSIDTLPLNKVYGQNKLYHAHTIYNGSAVQTTSTGLSDYKKTDMVFSGNTSSESVEGRSTFLPNGLLYSKQGKNFVYTNGKDKYAEVKNLEGFILQFASNEKDNFILTEKNLYKEEKPGAYQLIMENDDTLKYTTMAFYPNGDLLLAGYKGFSVYKKGNYHQPVLTLTAAEVTGWPLNKALQSIGISPTGEVLFAFDKLYKYADKKVSPVTGKASLIYTHQFDSKGNDYLGGIGAYSYYNGEAVEDLEILTAAYLSPDKRETAYINSIAVDDKDRCWALVNCAGKNGAVIFKFGKPVNFIPRNKLPVVNGSTKLFYHNKKLYFTTAKNGWAIVEYAD